jgi:hypothetical protein
MNLFKIVCIATSVLFIYLSFQLLFMSDAFVIDLGQQPSEATPVLCHRAAMFMIGVSVLMFVSRNLSHSKARQMICLATGTTLFGLNFMGWFEFFRGTVNNSIFVAITIETILWVSFAIILFKNREPKPAQL